MGRTQTILATTQGWVTLNLFGQEMYIPLHICYSTVTCKCNLWNTLFEPVQYYRYSIANYKVLNL